jgi:hypothetical protein
LNVGELSKSGGLFSEHCRRFSAERSMWPGIVVVHPPGVDRRSRIRDARKPVEVEKVRAEFAVEALDERVLGRLCRVG